MDLVQIDPAWFVTEVYIEVEPWTCDPAVLETDGIADTLSPALSLQDYPDERVSQAIDEMIEEYRR